MSEGVEQPALVAPVRARRSLAGHGGALERRGEDAAPDERHFRHDKAQDLAGLPPAAETPHRFGGQRHFAPMEGAEIAIRKPMKDRLECGGNFLAECPGALRVLRDHRQCDRGPIGKLADRPRVPAWLSSLLRRPSQQRTDQIVSLSHEPLAAGK